MIDAIRKAIIAVSLKAQRHEQAKLVRQAVGLTAKLVRAPSQVSARLEGLAEIMTLHTAETGRWVGPDALKNGHGGAFDACDLRHWLVLAERAGVPYVPAREIVSVSEDDISLASGTIKLPDNAMVRGVRKRMAALPEFAQAGPPEEMNDDEKDRRLRELEERLEAAMDDVPEGWMVRSARCGGSELKSLAGVGAAGPTVPEVRFGPNLEIGPGWVRSGNRRRVFVKDQRTMQSHAEGPGGDCVFLARPWVEASRFVVCEDPHRHGTPFAGKGIWPAEWRAFVEKGQVIGVAYYYGWCGEATPENAKIALQVRDQAQRVVNEAKALGAWPRYMDIEFARHNPNVAGNPALQKALADFPREDVACTLDFIEAGPEGLMLLEGGPAHSPFGGGHPCAFAGAGGRPVIGNKTPTVGVAFRLMPQVILADPNTWADGDREGCILDWDAVELLAASDLVQSPAP